MFAVRRGSGSSNESARSASSDRSAVSSNHSWRSGRSNRSGTSRHSNRTSRSAPARNAFRDGFHRGNGGRDGHKGSSSSVPGIIMDALFDEDDEEDELRSRLAEMSRLVDRCRVRTDKAVHRLKRQGRGRRSAASVSTEDEEDDHDHYHDHESSICDRSSVMSGESCGASLRSSPLAAAALVVPLSEMDAQSLAECVRRVVELAVEDEQRTFSPDRDEHRDLFGLATELGGWKTVLGVLSGEAFVTTRARGFKKQGIGRGRSKSFEDGAEENRWRGTQDGVTLLPPAVVAAQAWRSLSYLIRNVVQPTTLLFLMSDRRLRSLVDWPLDQYDGAAHGNELLAFHWGGGGNDRDRDASSSQPSLADGGANAKRNKSKLPERRIVRDLSENKMSGLEARFLSFLQTLALRLDGDTLKFFVSRPESQGMFGRHGGDEAVVPLYDRALGFFSGACGGGGGGGMGSGRNVAGAADLVRTTAASVCLGVLRLIVSSARASAANAAASGVDSDESAAAAMGSIHVLEAAVHACRPSVASSLIDPIVRRIERTLNDLVGLLREIDTVDARIASAASRASPSNAPSSSSSGTGAAMMGPNERAWTGPQRRGVTLRSWGTNDAASSSRSRRAGASSPAQRRKQAADEEAANSVRAAARQWRDGLVEAARGLLTDLRNELALVGEVLKIGLTALNEQAIEKILDVFSRTMWPQLRPPPEAIFTRMRRRLTNEAPPNMLLPLKSWAQDGSSASANPQGCSPTDVVETTIEMLAPSSFPAPAGEQDAVSARSHGQDDVSTCSSTAGEDLAPARAALAATAVLFESIPPHGPLAHLAFVALFHPFMPSPDGEKAASEFVEPRVATMEGGRLKFPRVLIDEDPSSSDDVNADADGDGDGGLNSCYDFGRTERRKRARRRERKRAKGRDTAADFPDDPELELDGRHCSYSSSAPLADLMEGTHSESYTKASSDAYATTLLNHRRKAMVAFLSGNAARHRSVAVLRPWARMATTAALEAVDGLVADAVTLGVDVTPSRAARLRERGRDGSGAAVSPSASASTPGAPASETAEKETVEPEGGDATRSKVPLEGSTQQAPPRGVTKKSSFPWLGMGKGVESPPAESVTESRTSRSLVPHSHVDGSETKIVVRSVRRRQPKDKDVLVNDPALDAAPAVAKVSETESQSDKNHVDKTEKPSPPTTLSPSLQTTFSITDDETEAAGSPSPATPVSPSFGDGSFSNMFSGDMKGLDPTTYDGIAPKAGSNAGKGRASKLLGKAEAAAKKKSAAQFSHKGKAGTRTVNSSSTCHARFTFTVDEPDEAEGISSPVVSPVPRHGSLSHISSGGLEDIAELDISGASSSSRRLGASRLLGKAKGRLMAAKKKSTARFSRKPKSSTQAKI